MFFVILFIISLLVFVYEKYLFAKSSRKDLMEFLIYSFQISKKWVKIYDKFDMLEGEKIIFPSTPGYFWQFEESFKDKSSWGYKSGSVLDVIVTNRRIMVGRILGISLSRFGFTVFTDEVFNKENYWHPQTDKILGNETDTKMILWVLM
jgi:hypothetical protein